MGDFQTLKAKVIDSGMCTGCGTCVFTCPAGIIQLGLSPTHDLGPVCQDLTACVGCGKCVDMCPVLNPPWEKSNLVSDLDSPSTLLGEYLEMRIGHASDIGIRQGGAAGGVVTALLVSMLNTNEIDGAIVMGLSETDPLQPVAKYVSSPSQVIAASSSKYVVAPLVHILSQIEKKRVAVVGLPCHMHGIENLRRAGRLKCKDLLRVGLFCGFNRSRLGIDYLMKTMGIDQRNISQFTYRRKSAQGEPGLLVQLRDGTEYFLSKARWSFTEMFFMPLHCALCTAYGNEFADISVGDLHSESVVSDALRWSLLVVRTETGEKCLREAEQRGDIDTRLIMPSDALNAHVGLASHKRVGALLRRQQMNIQWENKSSHVGWQRVPVARRLFEMILFRMALGFTHSGRYRRVLMHIPRSIYHSFLGRGMHRLNFSLPYRKTK